MNGTPPILLTSSVIAMDQSVCLKNPDSRVFHTLESIEKWMAIYPQGRYVLCDGSGFDFSNLVKVHFPGATIECISFTNSEKLVRELGKGYGEGEIIRYALKNSNFLKNSTWFIKCTAKLWVENFTECINSWNKNFLCHAFFSNVFSVKKTNLEYLDTRFYMTDKNFYLDNLSHVHTYIEGADSGGIEEKFLETLNNMNLEKYLFAVPPVVCGVGGGSGKYYKNSKIRQLKDLLRFRIVLGLNRYRGLFNID